MRYPSTSMLGGTLACALSLGAISQVQAYELYSDESRHLNADMTAVFGMFNSRKTTTARRAVLPGAKASSSMV